MKDKCEWYKIYKRIFNMELNREECNLMQAKCTCGGDAHNCDYPVALAMQLKTDASEIMNGNTNMILEGLK